MAINLYEVFDYDIITGNLIWRHRPDHYFSSPCKASYYNSRMTGNVAGIKNFQVKSGKPHSIIVSVWSHGVGAKTYGVHRIVWEMFNGPIPDGYMVDHVNGDPFDNRIANLRLATRAQNNQNTSLRKDNKTGCRGVCWDKKSNKYRVQVRSNGRRVYNKFFDDLNLAKAAYDEQARIHHGEFVRPIHQ